MKTEADVERTSAMARDVVRAARGWIGTPYAHQQSCRGVGADCLGLVRGVWREIYGDDAEVPPAYSRDWAESLGQETMLEAADRHFQRIDRSVSEPGTLAVFRMRTGAIAKHAGILTSATHMVHAMEGSGASEVALGAWWRRRIVGVFRFRARGDA